MRFRLYSCQIIDRVFWFQVHECGIHRGSVSGIHGRQAEGAYSIVISGGYKGDWDKGDEFMYSGSGGRDLKTGNKRTDTKQSCDQKLTSSNRALARNCDCPIDDKKGGVAKNWRNGRVVRVVSIATCFILLFVDSVHPPSTILTVLLDS